MSVRNSNGQLVADRKKHENFNHLLTHYFESAVLLNSTTNTSRITQYLQNSVKSREHIAVTLRSLGKASVSAERKRKCLNTRFQGSLCLLDYVRDIVKIKKCNLDYDRAKCLVPIISQRFKHSAERNVLYQAFFFSFLIKFII